MHSVFDCVKLDFDIQSKERGVYDVAENKNAESKTVRITAVVSEDDRERIKYFADKRGMSMNDYVRYALDIAMRREVKDYDLPTLEAARLNQLVDAMSALSFNVANLEHVIVSYFDSFLRLTRGENYLTNDDVID